MVLSLLLGIIPSNHASALTEGPQLRISRVDASAAPDISAYVTVEDAAGRPITQLQATDFRLLDNGKPATVSAINSMQPGLQIGIVVDASGSIKRAGPTGLSRIDEVREALSELLLKGGWLDIANRTDWVLVLVQQRQGLEVLTADTLYPTGWTNDYQLAYNKIYLYDSAPTAGPTPLFDTLLEAVRRMDSLPADAGVSRMPRSLIVFSDGKDEASKAEVQSVASAAESAGVTIHTVSLGDEPNTAGIANLQQLATLTKGMYTAYDGIASLRSLYQTLTGKKHQYELRYRMASAGSHYLQVRAILGSDGSAAEGVISFTDDLQPPVVSISAPNPNTVVEKRPTNGKTTLPVTLNVSWPDNRPRSLVEAAYYLDDTRFSSTQGPFERQTIPLDAQEDGQHLLRAEVVDEFGLRSRSTDIPLEIRSLQPLTVAFVGMNPRTTIRRVMDSWLGNVTQAEPRTQPIEITWQAPDGQPRAVKWVEYLIDGQSYRPSAEAMNLFNWDISLLEPGYHVLQVRLQDELGLISQSELLPVNITIERPPSPGLLTILTFLLAASAFVLVLYMSFRGRETVSALGKSVGGKVRAATQPWHPDRMFGHRSTAGAYLIVEEGAYGYADPVPLISSNTRIGRDESLVNLQFGDPTVSRLHCRISREQDGSHHIYDEGSTSGTYVNYSRVPMQGQLLQAGDILHIGRVRLRFSRDDTRGRQTSNGAPGSASRLPQHAEPQRNGDPNDTQPLYDTPPDTLPRPADVQSEYPSQDREGGSKTEPYTAPLRPS